MTVDEKMAQLKKDIATHSSRIDKHMNEIDDIYMRCCVRMDHNASNVNISSNDVDSLNSVIIRFYACHAMAHGLHGRALRLLSDITKSQLHLSYVDDIIHALDDLGWPESKKCIESFRVWNFYRGKLSFS